MDLDQMNIIRELGLPVADFAGFLDLSKPETGALTGACLRSEETRKIILEIDPGTRDCTHIIARTERRERSPQRGDNHDETRVGRDGGDSSAESEASVEQMNFLRELSLPVDHIAQLFDLPLSDADSLMRIANGNAETTQSNVPRVTESTGSLRIASSPYDQRPEGNMETEDCKPHQSQFSTALSGLKETIQSRWATVSIKNRKTIVEEVMELYKKCPSTAMHKLRVKFEEENGLDFGGVTRDMLASFWTDASQIFFHGEDILVPYLRLEKIRKGDNDFRVLGRVLSHTVALTGTLPFNMSVMSLISAFKSGESCVSDPDFLLEEYLMFVSREERRLMEKALSHFMRLSEDETDFLMHVFERYGHRCLPTKDNIKEKLTDIAAKVLIHDPTRYLQQMKEGMPDSHVEVFWSRLSKTAFRQLVEEQNPTPERVAGILTPTEELSLKETEVYSYLVNFVERLDKKSLRVFLQFVTGYTRLPKEGIQISFNHELRGLLRRPIAHTCSNQLDMPVHYSSYKDFVIEMTAILDNPVSMHMYME